MPSVSIKNIFINLKNNPQETKLWPWTKKNCHKGTFLLIEIYTSPERWINKLWENWEIEKFAFKVVQMKFLAMHFTNQKLSFDTFTVGYLQNIFMEHDLYLIS